MNDRAKIEQTSSKSGIQRRRPTLLALEQRFMFDGAAVDHAIDTIDTPAPDAAIPEPSTMTGMDPSLLEVGTDDVQLQGVAYQAQDTVRQYLRGATDEQLFALFNGGGDAPDADWTQRMSDLRAAIDDGSFTLRVVEMESASEFTAMAAYAGEGPDGAPTIFVNSGWFAMFGAPDATRALVEEIGHALDDYLNPDADTGGDEGEAFATAVLGIDAREGFSLGTETGQVVAGGVTYDVEFASFKFVNAYQMITDIDGDGIVDNTESWAEKEQETHTLMVGDPSINHGGLDSVGIVTVNDATNNRFFSGNDVSAVALNIGNQDYFGWISRPVKVQGQVVGFYFWTDQDFTDLSSAQVDGNRDTDTADLPGDPGVTDNKGFILVVDQSYFNGLIDAGMTPVSVSASPVWSAVTPGTYNTIQVKSSSDRVDTALNNLLGPETTPAALVATDDVASGSPGTSGGAALEEGADDNSVSLNVLTSNGNLTDTIDATGNVLTNDVNSDGLAPLEVIAIASGGTNESADVSASAAGVVAGRYGTLTLNADGTYTYVIDNRDPAVEALLSTSTPLEDVFTYTIDDGIGGTASATLTVQIRGSNDAPVAADDYNVAKESLLSDSTAYSGSDTVGAVATGDVTLNDADLDHSEADKTIVGLDETGAATAGTYTASGASTTLTFATSTNINSVSVGANVFWDQDSDTGTKQVAVAVSDGAATPTYTLITVTAKADGEVAGTTDFTLSATPTHYWNGAAWTAFTDVTAQLGSGARYFEFGAANGNVAANSAKGGTLILDGVDVVVSVDITGASGSIYEGMVVTALDGSTSVLPSGTVVTKVNHDGSGNITSIELSNDFSPKPSDPSGYALSFTMPTGGDTTITTAYGTLELLSDGSYTYTPIANNPLLDAGETVVESFTYIMQDALGAKSEATLHITVVGSGTNDPVAGNDAITAVEAGGISNGTAGSDPSATASPNRLIDNDTTDTSNFPNKYVSGVTSVETGNSGDPAASSEAANTGTGPAVVVGKYGTFTVGADGSYVYTVDNANPTVEALRISGETLSETFTYVVKNYDVGNSTLGGVDTAVVTVTIQGANDAPVAANDSVTATAGLAAPTGNVLNNDVDVDAGDTKTVLFVEAGTTATPGTPVSGAVAITGTYGTLTINPDGTYSYAVDQTNDAVKALAAGATTSETFSYQMEDASGAVSSALLTVTVTGTNDAPVNGYPASVTGAVDTPILFTGANLVSVGDVDGNLQSVTLHVDHGTLSATGSGGTIDGAGTADLVITGTQAEINAILATLSYTPSGGYTGADFLTIFSQDSGNAYDSDGFAINIPTAFTGPTVLESDLSSGSNPGGTGETASTTLSAPSGQTFGTVDQSGSDAYGTWTLTTAGVFTYTLTTAPDVAGASTARSIDILTYDAFGNSTVNTVSVTILDDGPSAIADTNSATDGGSAVTGNVLSDGTDDSFGADGPAPSGGVVGVRAAGGDTSTAVTTGTGTSIAGLYGSLTLNADGSYTYTPASNALAASANDVFVYTIEDADGSRSTTTLTISVAPSLTPTAFTGPTVLESDLSSGSNPGGTGETASTTLSAPSGQTFGTVDQSGSDAYGTWTLTTAGVFTYTLTTAPDVAGASTARSIDILTYDAFGNSTVNTVSVTILDDGPSAVADTNSATDGGSAVTGNVLSDGTDDSFGADGPAPSGGVVGVRAAGGDTSSAVATGTGTSIAGLYGSLTLNADGSYTYTPASNALAASANDVFVYTIEDADGSRSTTTLTISIVPAGTPSADLSIAKSVDTGTPELNGEVVYTLVVTNNGASEASNVRVTDELPAGLSFVGASLDGTSWDTDGTTSNYVVDPSGNDLWTVGNLASGASRTLYIKAVVTSSAVIVNTASVTSDTYDPDTANNTDNGSDGNQTVDALGPTTVTGGSYNEDAARAIFTVDADNGRMLTLDVRDVAAAGKAPTGDGEGKPDDTLDTAPIFYSLDGGATWHRYTGAPVQAGSVPVLVAVDITAERDDVYEGEESFQLVVNAEEPSEAAGYASIFDDGTGTVTDPIDETTTNDTGTDNDGPKDDDRIVAPPPPPPPPRPPVEPGGDPRPLPPVLDPATSPVARPDIFASAGPDFRLLAEPSARESGLSESYTSLAGFPIIVIDGSQSSLTIYRGVADQYADSGSASSFAVPYDAFAHTDPTERIVLSANLADGRGLPSWVVFDAQSGKFVVTPPREFVGELKIKVTARDSQGREISTLFRFSVGEKRSEITGGRQSFSAQLNTIGHVSMPEFVTLNAVRDVSRAT
ncbi:VCBS domain-containing protein [Breoghania sp.]|uniref:VCBS domain-containing protein n=1 Tax=Breoghania sp. TaxID=2065378 RepID=UPI002AAC3F36|nr:VCBS domain-containing protein [Breoghania sp.]